MKKLLSLLLMVLMLLGGAAFAEENEEDTTPVVAPIVTFKSGFYVGYLDREIKITVSCKNKNSATVPEKYLELRNHRGEVLERAFWRNPRYDLTFSVYVTEDMLGGNKLSVWLDGEKVNETDSFAAFSDISLPRVTRLTPSEPAVGVMIVCSGASEKQLTDMLNTLDKYGVKGTFYVTGDFVRRNPERIQRIIDAGHELGSHGNNLINMTEVSYARVQENIRELNDLCHKMDSTRLTTLACYAMCGPFNRSAHITDMVSWNLYLGWYVPGFILNDLWMGFFHLCFPNRPFGYSEYGAEGMPNLHSAHPHRGDHTEEYQAKYHEYMLRCFKRHPWMWATHVWNMFDFAADARDQGGEPGMNHKGLVTFDRKTKKDSFYLYKAWWSEENFVHICSKRFTDRTEKEIEVKVYSNQKSVTLYADGKKLAEQTGEHIFKFRVPLHGKVELKAVAGDCIDTACFRSVAAPNPSYKLVKTKSKSANWV